MAEPFQLPTPANVPILGQRTDQDEAIARLALAVSILNDAAKDVIGAGKHAFIKAALGEVLDQFGPIDVEHWINEEDWVEDE